MCYTEKIRKELRLVIRELGLLNKNSLNSKLTLLQAHILSYLNKNGATTAAELKRELGVDKASLSRSISTLSQKSYIKTAPHPFDKRSKLIELLSTGKIMIQESETAADRTIEDIFQTDNQSELIEIHGALKKIHSLALKNNIRKNQERLIFEELKKEYYSEAMDLVNNIFLHEQNIPEELIKAIDTFSPKWWCVRIGEEIAGVAALWKEKNTFHWGRFAVDKTMRSMGLGSKLAKYSLTESFKITDKPILLEARDKTIGIIEKSGGKITSEPFDFYGEPVTPMVIQKDLFIQNQ